MLGVLTCSSLYKLKGQDNINALGKEFTNSNGSIALAIGEGNLAYNKNNSIVFGPVQLYSLKLSFGTVSLGINDPEMFPTVTDNYVHFSNKLPNDQVILIDLTGKELQRTLQNYLDVSFLEPGIYIARIIHDNEVLLEERLIKL